MQTVWQIALLTVSAGFGCLLYLWAGRSYDERLPFSKRQGWDSVYRFSSGFVLSTADTADSADCSR